MDPAMKRLTLIVVTAAAVLALGACNKPTEENCRKALANMQRLMGTENVRDPAQLEGEVRRCKGGSKKQAVDCAIKAQTFDELKHCNFYHLPDNLLPDNLKNGSGAATPDTTGSAAGSAAMGSDTSGSGAMGSGAMGSAAMGSAAMGSGAGSAAMGSGAGSGATGSATGSAAISSGAAAKGSAAGSAAK
jgi:hypothetical protein